MLDLPDKLAADFLLFQHQLAQHRCDGSEVNLSVEPHMWIRITADEAARIEKAQAAYNRKNWWRTMLGAGMIALALAVWFASAGPDAPPTGGGFVSFDEFKARLPGFLLGVGVFFWAPLVVLLIFC